MKKRILIYLCGIAIMAFGVTLLARSDLGNSPISSIPYAISQITPFTFGTTTMAFHLLCIIFQVMIWRRVMLQMILQIPLGLGFSALIDLYMSVLAIAEPELWLRALLGVGGVVFTALGIVIIVSMDLMLPAPDSFLRAVSQRFNIELYKVKIAGDVTWVCTTIVISLIFTRSILAVGIGTLFSMYFTGKFVGIFKKHLGFLEMEPTAVAWERYKAEAAAKKQEKMSVTK